MKPHFLFDVDQGYIVGSSIIPVFGHDEETDAFGTFGCTFGPCKKQVDDVFRHIMFTSRDELLGTLDQIMSFRLLKGSGDNITD